MNNLLRYIFRDNPVLAGFAAVGPLLLLSNRLVYSLGMSAVYIVFFSLMSLIIWLIDRFLLEQLRFSAKIFAAAVLIAVIDMVFTAYFPLIRQDIGVMLPLILTATPFYLQLSLGGKGDDESGESVAASLGALYGKMLGFILVLNLIAVIRELLAYGGIDLSLKPWQAGGSGGSALLIFATGFGLLLILAYAKSLFSKVVK